MKALQALWVYRSFILSAIKHELYARLIRSRLGIVWIVIHPLAQAAIYAFVLSTVLASKLPGIQSHFAYAIYLLSGILAWTLFAEVMHKNLMVFIEQANVLKKMAFPKLALPIIIGGSALVNNMILLAVILLLFAALGHTFSMALLWLPLLIVLTLLLAASLGLILGIVHVFVRDIGQFVPMMMQVWFWLTPIVYTVSIIPERFHLLIKCNPMFPIVMNYQSVLVYGKAPELSTLGYPAVWITLASCLAAWIYYKAHEEMVDLL